MRQYYRDPQDEPEMPTAEELPEKYQYWECPNCGERNKISVNDTVCPHCCCVRNGLCDEIEGDFEAWREDNADEAAEIKAENRKEFLEYSR